MTTQKKWLISFWMYLFGGAFSALTLHLSETQFERTLGGIVLIWLFVWALITYHCAYRKRGTRWLKFLLVMLPFYVVKSLIRSFKELPTVPLELTIFITTFVLAIEVWFWFSCKALREENLELKKAIPHE
jgi:hypothetical protein